MASCLLVVLIAARIITLAAHPVPASPLMPFALVSQDLAVVLVFAAFERIVRHPLPARVAYAVIVAFVAITLPVVRVLGTPLTAPMLRAATGTLSDSIRYHATTPNMLAVAGIIALGVALPFIWKREHQPGRRWIPVAAALVLLGPTAARRVETNGLERNAVWTLARTAVPRVHAGALTEMRSADWRSSPFGGSHGTTPSPRESLAALRTIAPRANVLLIILESTAAQYLGAFGATSDPTPNLSALARRSVVFTNAYTAYPESVKGLVATLASRYPGFDVSAEHHAPMMSASVATALAHDGYKTGLFHSGRFVYLGMSELLANAGFERLEDAGDIGGNHASSFGVDERAAVDHVLRWIDAVPRRQPFFAAYLPIAGHHPYGYSMPGPFDATDESNRYRNALHEGDAAIGTLLRGLAERGLDSSTVVVVFGDHGEAFGQHRGNYGHDLALYEENVHVPLLIARPVRGTRAQARLDVDYPVSLMDVAPTILDLVGVHAPAAFQGNSLLGAEPGMALFFTDYSLGLLGLRDGCMKYTYEMESRRSKLFDVCTDPAERINVASSAEARVVFYRERLRAWSAAQVTKVRAAKG